MNPPALTRSPSKWAALSILATIVLLTALALPTSASRTSAPLWISPLPGDRPVISGYRPHVKRTSALHVHKGIDFAATFGEEIRAPIDGVISYSGTINEIPIVVLTHLDQLALRRTTYLPATTDLPIGSLIAQGANFARVAPIFHCSRPCLHWGERIGTSYLNPMKHLGRAVLLPRFS